MSSPTFSPLYQQVKALLFENLRSGVWRRGEAIPSEVELAVQFKASQGTVRKAIKEFAADNHLVRRQGRGSFVTTHGARNARLRCSRLAPNFGETRMLERQLLELRRSRVGADIARLLDIKAGDPMVMIRRRLLFGGAACIGQTVIRTAPRWTGLAKAQLVDKPACIARIRQPEQGAGEV